MTYGTMEKIETVIVPSGGQAAIEFLNIPATYDDLKIVFSARGTSAQINAVLQGTFNGSTAANYSWRQIQGNSSTAGSSATSSSTFLRCGYVPDTSTTTNTFSNIEVYIPNYRSSNAKSVSIDAVQENNSAVAGETLVLLIAGLWGLTSAITSMSFNLSAGNFAQYSSATLYGITRVPAGAKATGGVIYDDASYWYHVFTSSGTFTPSQSLSCDVLVVAGGGGGGGEYGGGGGAGGVSYQSARSLSSTNYTVTVGAGGASRSGPGYGNDGSNSVFDTITSNGGGGGGYWQTTGFNGRNGGSGGGGGMGTSAGNTTSGGTATQGNSGGATGYGNNGGQGYRGSGTAYFGGGGGGSGAVGANATTSAGGAGGAGRDTWSSILSAVSLGVNGFIAGGGGGSAEGGTSGAGGSGGGGAGAQYGTVFNGVAAAINTGSGGGAQSGGGTSYSSGAGGSGVVIVRYAK